MHAIIKIESVDIKGRTYMTHYLIYDKRTNAKYADPVRVELQEEVMETAISVDELFARELTFVYKVGV